MITLGTLGGLSALSMGGSKAKKEQGPPINAQSPDEESFIKYVEKLGALLCGYFIMQQYLTVSRDFLKNAEADAKKDGSKDKAVH